ncbi:MAG: AAA family ATPase [Marinobacterium sp.]|nr:AAA family ATPase [Marinobacterium sp.]
MTPETPTPTLDPFIILQPLPSRDGVGLLRSWPGTLAGFKVQAAYQHEQQIYPLAVNAQLPTIIVSTNSQPQLTYQTRLKRTLAELCPAQLPFCDRLQLAISLTEALDSLHRQDIFHLSLRPGTFLISDDFHYAELIDLSCARHCPKGSLGLPAMPPLFASPHWLAPEQSYPADRLADNRTDLYSLGAILVWLFSGQPPFAPLQGERELAYAHMASAAQLPTQLPADAASALTALLQALLTKEADSRYQSCSGLLADLQAIQHSLQQREEAPLPTHLSLCDRLHIANTLYGRTTETAQLLQAFQRVSEGASEAILIAGYSGVGKSALVNAIHKPILQADGLFVSGKFDQFQRGTPYSALVQAFSQIVRTLLAQPAAQVSHWRKQLNSILAPNGQILTALIPELEQLLGPQPIVPALGPEEQQHRFNRTFMLFVREICRTHKPLVLFIDDLQWADLASIKLLQQLLSDPDSQHCLLLGAYRDNEVDERHPFIRMLAELEHSERLQALTLQPLPPAVVTQLLADSLQLPAQQLQALTRLIHEKTGGNPFFLRQFIQELYQRELLVFGSAAARLSASDQQNASGHAQSSNNAAQPRWRWSMSAIAQQNITDNVVELMLNRITRLPPHQQLYLQQAACIGARFSLSLLAQLAQLPPAQLRQQLRPLFSLGLLLPVREPGPASGHETPDGLTEQQVRFLHDRVQQAAAASLSEPARQQIHLQLGRLLLAARAKADADSDSPSATVKPGPDDNCFELAGHFNQVRALLQPQEYAPVLQLNYQAALKAHSATAYATAVSYLDHALSLAGADTDSVLLDDIWLLKLECLYLAGEFTAAEALRDTVSLRCSTASQCTRFYNVLITQYTRYGKLQQAIEQGLQALHYLGNPLPARPDMDDLGAAIAEAQQNLQVQPFARLVHKPAITDQQVLLTLDILMAMQPCCYNAGGALFPLTILELLKLTMQHGNSPCSSYVYMMYGLLCTKALKDYDTAFEAAHYSAQVARDYPANPLLEGRLLMMRSNFILPWQQPLSASASMRDEAYHQCLEQGDYYWGIHSYIFGFYSDLFSTPSLARLLQRTEQVVSTCQQIKQPAQVYLAQLQCNLLRILQGSLDNQQNLDHSPGFEQQALQHFQQHHYLGGRYDRLLGRLLQGYLLGNYQQALGVALSPSLTRDDLDEGIFHEATYTLFNLLALLALQLRGDTLSRHQREWQADAWPRYQRWYALNPTNFSAGYHLLQAEQQALAGDHIEARCSYERAIGHAAQSGQALLQAVASERAAHYNLSQQDIAQARAWLEKALRVYQDWGAHAKADEMETLLAQVSDQHLLSDTRNLDWHSVLNASQALTRHSTATELIHQLLQQASQITGARQAAFFRPLTTLSSEQVSAAIASPDTASLEPDGNWQLVALNREGQQTTAGIDSPMPEAVLNYCLHSGRTLVLKDAVSSGRYVLETDFQRRQVRSVLALPLQAQSRTLGVLYLEHDATRQLFSAHKVKVMELLTSQFAISWQNIRYFEQLQHINAQLEQTVTERTRQLHKKNRHLEAILQALPIPFVITGVDGQIIEGNAQLFELFELKPDQRQGVAAPDFYAREEDRAILLQRLHKAGHVDNFECQLKTTSGRLFWAQFSATLIELDNGQALFSAVSDISDRKQKEALLQQQATTDPLTGALNRRAFSQQAMTLYSNGGACCIAMLDLDHFKKLNDSFGHAAGDEVLRQFVLNVRASLREQDMLCRVGGEEFALLLYQNDAEQGRKIIERICQQTAAMTVTFNSQSIHFTTSGGMVQWRQGEALEQALERADQLLYQAKRNGRNRVVTLIPGKHGTAHLTHSSPDDQKETDHV